MSSRDAPNLELADSSPTRPGRKHRRGRGQASRKSSLMTSTHNMLTESHNYLHNHPYTKQANYYASDSWDNAAVGSPRNNHTNNKDDNSCTGSLTYSASSSVQSAESSNDSSFADIIKLLDSTEGGGDGGVTDVHKFIANNSMKAMCCNDNQKKKNKIKKLFSMSGGYKSNRASNEELDYSSNDSEDELEHAKQFETDVDNKILDTIAGHDDDNVASRTLVTSHSIHDKEEEVEILSISTLSAPSTPRSRRNRGDVTPSPNSRSATTSFPSNVSRTGSRNSRSSSDGSIDTPTPSSPTNPAKPPVRRKGTAGGKEGEGGDSVEELSTAFYAKSWMCGFTDAFNF